MTPHISLPRFLSDDNLSIAPAQLTVVFHILMLYPLNCCLTCSVYYLDIGSAALTHLPPHTLSFLAFHFISIPLFLFFQPYLPPSLIPQNGFFIPVGGL